MTLHKIDIEKLLSKWQKRLGLSDWEITAERAPQNHVSGQAKTTIYSESQIARIFLLDESDRQGSDPNDKDIEHDLIHELLHVRLWAIDPKKSDDNTHVLREQAIDWIAKALLSSDRKPDIRNMVLDPIPKGNLVVGMGEADKSDFTRYPKE